MRRAGNHVLAFSFAAALYLILARVAEEWSGDLLPIPLWLATAGTVGIALVVDRQLWPAVVAGGAIVGNVASGLLFFDETIRSLALPALSVFVETVAAIAGITWAISPGNSLRRTRRALRVLSVSIASAAVGASIATIDTASTIIDDRADAWLKWAAGDLNGLLVVVPLVLAPRTPVLQPPHRFANAEAAAMFALTIGATVGLFTTDVPLIYLIIPAVMWLAIRFGARFAAPAAFLVTLIATYMSGQGYGPFVSHGGEPTLQVQGFNLAVAVCAMVAAAHATRAWDDQQRLGATLRALPDAVIVKDPSGAVVNAWIPSRLRGMTASLTAHDAPDDNPLARIEPGLVDPNLFEHTSGRLLEHRTTPVTGTESLHLFRDVTEERDALRRQRQWEDELELARLETQVEIGRVLHDGPIQEVSAALLHLGQLHGAGEDAATTHRRAMHTSLESAVTNLRSLAHGLIPAPTTEGGIVDALRNAGREILQPNNIRFEAPDTDVSIEAGPIAQTLYLVGREALANAAWHSQATTVVIELDETEDSFVLEIRDDGIGFRRSIEAQRGEGIRPHLGLQLMTERLGELGGRLLLEPSINDGQEGLRVVATVPRHGAQS